MKHIYCYKMTWDTEFAPNPHYGVLTLATCKPTIRRCAEVGDWISGWTAVKVMDKERKPHHFRDGEELIFLARITDKIEYDEYWKKYPQKRPHEISSGKTVSKRGCGASVNSRNKQYDSGDNIYEPINNTFYQHDNGGDHGEKDKEHDLKGKYVLICEEFYYFGGMNTKKVGKEIFPFTVPRCKKLTMAEGLKFIQFIQENYNKGINTP